MPISKFNMVVYQRERKAKRKREAFKILGKKCATCENSNENVLRVIYKTRALQGKNWPAKIFEMSEERFKNELAKCELICALCHYRKNFQ